MLQWRNQRRVLPIVQDEYTAYIQAPLVQTNDARLWWMEPTQRATYPNLSIMALDILSILAMSAALERLFSGAKITITDRRNRLGIEAVQALECLKSWLKKTALTFVDSALSDVLLENPTSI